MNFDGGQPSSWLGESLAALTVESELDDYTDQPVIQHFSNDLDALSRKIAALAAPGSDASNAESAQATVDADYAAIQKACG